MIEHQTGKNIENLMEIGSIQNLAKGSTLIRKLIGSSI